MDLKGYFNHFEPAQYLKQNQQKIKNPQGRINSYMDRAI